MRLSENQRGSLWRDILAGAVGGLIAAAVLGGITFFLRNEIQDIVDARYPTCLKPTGLTQVSPDRIRPTGQSLDPAYDPSMATDGYLGSMWIPPLRPESKPAHQALYLTNEGANTLTLRLDEPVDVKLVCVNNGVANNAVAYANWGRVRTVLMWTSDNQEKTPTTLISLPTEELQQMQAVATDIGTTDTLNLQLVDSYTGLQVQTFDASSCNVPAEYAPAREDGEVPKLRYERGCLRAPIPRAGLSEVVVFTK